MTIIHKDSSATMDTGSSSLPSPRENLAIDFIELHNVVSQLQTDTIPELKYPFTRVQKDIEMIITTMQHNATTEPDLLLHMENVLFLKECVDQLESHLPRVIHPEEKSEYPATLYYETLEPVFRKIRRQLKWTSSSSVIPRVTRQYTNLLSEFLYLAICYNRYHAL